jgi:hypothetical protein
MAAMIPFALKFLPFKATFTPLIKTINNMPNYLKAMVISLIGTFVPFTLLWFVHLFWGIIIAVIISKIFSTGTFASFVIGMTIITVAMFFIYWILSKGIITPGLNAFLASRGSVGGVLGTDSGLFGGVLGSNPGLFGGRRKRRKSRKSKKSRKSRKHRKSRKSRKIKGGRKSRKSRKHRTRHTK